MLVLCFNIDKFTYYNLLHCRNLTSSLFLFENGLMNFTLPVTSIQFFFIEVKNDVHSWDIPIQYSLYQNHRVTLYNKRIKTFYQNGRVLKLQTVEIYFYSMLLVRYYNWVNLLFLYFKKYFIICYDIRLIAIIFQ